MDAIKKNSLLWTVLFVLTLFACNQEIPILSALFTPLSARAQYEKELKASSASNKSIFLEWDSIGNSAFIENVEIPTPYRQTGYFLKDRMEVLAFQLPLKKGEQIDIEINIDSIDTAVFMDFFQKRNGKWYPILKNKKGQTTFHFVVPETETFLLRIQPELQKTSPYEIKILKNPTYAFPVAGKSNPDIWSFWGDPRGGGKRKHKGIDIFAKRGTPLLAATKGRVSNVSDRGLGGKQVWIRDAKNKHSLYYAHLDKQLVYEGQYVEVGDTIGLVGNTGNAKNTRPHLHFGIYIRFRGAVDPLPFVYTYRNKFLSNTAKVKADTLGKGLTLAAANLRSKPSSKESLIKQIDKGSPVELLGASGRWYHVRTQEGEVGFIHYTSLRQSQAVILS